QDRSREPARGLVHAQGKLLIAPAVGQGAEEVAKLATYVVEATAVARLAEGEVVFRRRCPRLSDAVVGPRDPHALSARDRLALGRRGQLLAFHLHVCWPFRSRRIPGRRAEVRLAELLPDRVQHARRVRAGMLAYRLDPGLAQDRVVRVPAEDLVGEEIEVLVDPEAAAPED